MKLLFAGTPVFAEFHLQALIDSEHEICAVYTQPDRPAGRGKKLHASPVKQLAIAHNIPVMQPQNFRDDADREILYGFHAELMVVVAYGLILPKAILEAPLHGCINVHGSILPTWRGAAPIQRAIETGDKQSGVTIMQMDIGLDTGDMLLKVRCPIEVEDTSATLHDKLCGIGPEALLSVINQIAEGQTMPVVQNDADSSYAHKIEKSEAHIDWSLDADTILRKIRAFNPFPVSYVFFDEKRVKIYHAHKAPSSYFSEAATPGSVIVNDEGVFVRCSDAAIALDELQLPGKKPMPVKDFLNGPAQHLDIREFC